MPDPSGERIRETVDAARGRRRTSMQIVAEIEAIVDRPPDSGGEWVERLRDRLPELHRGLERHFALEAGEPFYTEFPTRFPRYADRVLRLQGEHERILAMSSETAERCLRFRSSEIYEHRELNAAVQLLLATIRRHEAEENEVLLSAYWDDVGTGD